MNNRKLIRLTESDLHRIVRMSVNKLLREVKYGKLPVGYNSTSVGADEPEEDLDWNEWDGKGYVHFCPLGANGM